MRLFRCTCGQRLFFDNTHCLVCGRLAGFDPAQLRLLALVADGERLVDADGAHFRHCGNRIDYGVCNWLVRADHADRYCLACGLNQVIPSLVMPEIRLWWSHMEAAKRRLLFTLLSLGLPVRPRSVDPDTGLAFAFLEDRRSNPQVEPEHVLTGYADGLITVNLAEASPASREQTRAELAEPYRTLLGHFRHESGHHYFALLVRDELCARFRELFGDERADFPQALQRYYAGAPPPAPAADYVSRYASAHPIEDWAESWAHYLHMVDTLETAAQFQMMRELPADASFDALLGEWMELSIALNELNRSMGLSDAYPFVLSPAVIEKLRFVHRAAGAASRPFSGPPRCDDLS